MRISCFVLLLQCQKFLDALANNSTYLAFNDLTRFVNATIESEENTELLTRIFCFVEAAARTRDAGVEDVLQDALYVIAVAPV